MQPTARVIVGALRLMPHVRPTTIRDMAEGTRFVRRNRSTPGRALGYMVCRISLPAIGEPFERRLTNAAELRLLLSRELPVPEIARDGAAVTVSAAVRKPNRAIGRRRLGQWRAGEPLEAFIRAVGQLWRALPKEEDWSRTIVVHVPDQRPVGRRRKRKHAV